VTHGIEVLVLNVKKDFFVLGCGFPDQVLHSVTPSGHDKVAQLGGASGSRRCTLEFDYEMYDSFLPIVCDCFAALSVYF